MARLRQEPYKADAVDADNDGIVQEGTAFERPAGTQIVDEFRRIIENGRNSMSRGSGWRVIDRDGNDVNYRPTYGDGGAELPERPEPRSALGSTLGESRGTLAATNGGTLGQRSGTLGDGRPDAPAVTPEIAAAPDVVPDTQGGTADVVPGSTAKGEAFRQRVTEAGGFDITQISGENHEAYKAYAQDLKDRGVLGDGYRPARSRSELSQHFEDSTQSIKDHIDKELADQFLPEAKRQRYVELKRRLDAGESVEDLAKETARKHRAELDDEDTQVRIDFSAGILDDIIGSGGFISSADDKAQDVSSAGGQGSTRNQHEAALGIPPSLSSEGRPVSGYIVSGSMHRSRTDDGVQTPGFNADFGDADQDESVRRVNMIGAYGDSFVVLKKDSIRDRSATGHGDAVSYGSTFGKTFDGDEDDSVNSLFNDVGGTLRGSNGSASRTADTLAWGVSDEDLGGLVRQPGSESSTMKKGTQSTEGYQETFITGGVGLEDIAEMSLPAGMDEPFATVTGKKFDGVSGIEVSSVNDDARKSGIQEMLMDDSVTAFLTPEETAQLREAISGGITDDVWSQLQSSNSVTSLTHMRRLQKREEIRKRLTEKGFDGKVTFGFSGQPPGLDLENPNNPAFAAVADRSPQTGYEALSMITADRLRGILSQIKTIPFDGIQTKAAKLKLEPYNPDAIDGDNDGIVQEGTAWERPATTIIIDALGFAIDYGKMSGNRLPGQKIVDRDGNPVNYTPSYIKEPTKKPDGPPIHGISSLADIAGGKPIAKPPKPAKPPKKQSSLFGLPKKWKEPKKAKFKIPEQKYDTPLLGEVMITDGLADTSKALFDKKEGRYIKERRRLHKAIVKWHREKSKPKADGEPRTIFFLGGGPGSGKTSMFKAGVFGADPDTVRVDPDEIKTMIPEYRKWISENYVESAGMVHGESKHITELTTASLIDDGADMVYDTTGDGNYNGMRQRLEEMRRNGHKISARYSTISIAKAHQINEERFKETGRKVPGHQVDHVHRQVSVNVMRAIADGLFDDLELYDNEDFPAEPKLILRVKDGNLEILDDEKVKAFVSKAGPGLQPGRKSSDPMHMTMDSAVEASLESLETSGSDAEIAAWKFYKGTGFRNINGTLRDPNFIEDDAFYNEVVEAIETIDEMFDNHSTSVLTPTTAYRGTVDTFRADEVPEEYIDTIADIIAKTKQQGDKPILQDRESLEIIAEAMNADINPMKPFTYREDAYMSTGRVGREAEYFAAGTTMSPELIESIAEEEDLIGIPVVMELSVPAGTRFMAGNSMESESVFDRGTGTTITRYEVVEGPEGKFHIRAYAEMRPAKGKPSRLEKVELPEGSETQNKIFDDDDAM